MNAYEYIRLGSHVCGTGFCAESAAVSINRFRGNSGVNLTPKSYLNWTEKPTGPFFLICTATGCIYVNRLY